MSTTTTRLSDLPENITVQMPQQQQHYPQQQHQQQQQHQGFTSVQSGDNNNSNNVNVPTYTPMNIHPNPYGNSPQPGVMQPPIQQQQQQYDSAGNNNNTSPQYPLPSRDIPMNIGGFTHDESIKPNYVPMPIASPHNIDYLTEYSRNVNPALRGQDTSRKQITNADMWIGEIRLPLLIAMLFFVFQMPVVQMIIFRKFAFLSMIDNDGQPNLQALLMRSILFGGAFYIITRTIGLTAIIGSQLATTTK